MLPLTEPHQHKGEMFVEGFLLFLLICIALPFALPTILSGFALIVATFYVLLPSIVEFAKRAAMPVLGLFMLFFFGLGVLNAF